MKEKYVFINRPMFFGRNPFPRFREPLFRMPGISKFLTLLVTLLVILLQGEVRSQPLRIKEKISRFDWIQTARVFLIDAYQPPFAPELEYDAEALAEAMAEMNVNVIRFPSMGKYATIQGVRFSIHPDQGERDLLQETIDACKPRGIRVIPYISTGHKLAWSMVTEDYPEYGQRVVPGGQPNRTHMYVGEDHGTVCWMTPYREAYMDLLEHIVRDYDIDGVYFDGWTHTHYFWPGLKICYCDGCRKGFREATGLDIPWHEDYEPYSYTNNDPLTGRQHQEFWNRDYFNEIFTEEEFKTIDLYHEWYEQEYIGIVQDAAELIRSYKDIPLITNIGNPQRMASMDPRVINAMDAFLYERVSSLLSRAQGVGVPRSVGLHVTPYIGIYHNWPRLTMGGVSYQQQIFTNLMFGGGSIIAQPTGYIYDMDNSEYVSYPFGIIKENEKVLNGLENVRNVGVVYAFESPPGHSRASRHEGVTDARTSTSGAFAACLYNHVQVGSISEFVLDDPARLKKYPMLYLANVPFLSPQRIRNIAEYVSNGGSLVASYDVSLYDRAGNRQSSFGMENLLRVRPIIPEEELSRIMGNYTCMLRGPNDLYLLARNKIAVPFQDFGERLYPLWYYEPVEVLEGAEVLMDIVTGPDRKAILPGVVMSEYGKGKVIYCSSALESLYNNGVYDMLGALISNLVEAVLPGPSAFTMDAPASLVANLTEKDGMMVLHLTNWSGNKSEHPNEYSLSPVENVRLNIRVPDGKKVKVVYTLVRSDFEKKLAGHNLEVFIPSVGAYQAVVVELE